MDDNNMYIECFLHSIADTGEFLGFEGLDDIFEFSGCDLALINKEFNDAIKEAIPKDIWKRVKDSVFRITFNIYDGKALPDSIERIEPIFRI